MLAKKALQKLLQKREARQFQIRDYYFARRLPDLVTTKNCSNKKQLFGHMLKQVFVIFSENADWVQNRCRVLVVFVEIVV